MRVFITQHIFHFSHFKNFPLQENPMNHIDVLIHILRTRRDLIAAGACVELKKYALVIVRKCFEEGQTDPEDIGCQINALLCMAYGVCQNDDFDKTKKVFVKEATRMVLTLALSNKQVRHSLSATPEPVPEPVPEPESATLTPAILTTTTTPEPVSVPTSATPIFPVSFFPPPHLLQ